MTSPSEGRSAAGESAPANCNHTSHTEFYEYYSRASQSRATLRRFEAVRDAILRLRRRRNGTCDGLEVADIGCGAGTQAILWSGSGHRVHAIDINEPLLNLARERSRELGEKIDFHLGTAAQLPWPDGSMDVCLAPELLEHVPEWEACVSEFARILRPGGVLYLSTSNKLCPFQQEFRLPLYSWYPRRLKRHFERLASTSRPELANYATYPAVNWFTFYGLRAHLRKLGLRSVDRFDVMDPSGRPVPARLIIRAVRTVPQLRGLAHVVTPYTVIYAEKVLFSDGERAGRRSSAQ